MANITVGFDDETKEVLRDLTKALDSAGVAEKASRPDGKPAKGKPAKKAPAKKAEESEDDGPARDDVRIALKEYAALEGKEAAIAILKGAGASSIGELDEDRFQEVIEACE